MKIGLDRKGMHVTILGGGLGGLGVGYYASRGDIPFTVYEAGARVGGNCVTLRRGDFRFDSGAHRFHDKDPEITTEMRKLLGGALKTVDVPSKVYDRGRLLDFPLRPFDLARNLGVRTCGRVALEVLRERFRRAGHMHDFEGFAVNTYGRTVAERFLLNYSRKLWGRPCRQLSPVIGGKRLQGLNLRTFMAESIRPGRSDSKHMEGVFYYPTLGIETISKRLVESFDARNVMTGSAITSISHDGRRIHAVEVNGQKWVLVDEVVSTLPLDRFLAMMRPAAPARLLDIAGMLQYRNLMLVTLFLNVPSVIRAATVYFPDVEFPFTRVYEPKNRCPQMAPADQTSLVAEIPCDTDDALWSLDDERITERVRSSLEKIGWVGGDQVIDTAVIRLKRAYPILTLDAERAVGEIAQYLERFSNLAISGRNGKFIYSSIHDMMRLGKTIVDRYAAGREDRPRIVELKGSTGEVVRMQTDTQEQILSS